MDNMFENVKFGDEFKTRDGRKLIYLCKSYAAKYHALSIENDSNNFYHLYHDDGKIHKCWNYETEDVDVVGRWDKKVEESNKVKEIVEFLADNISDFVDYKQTALYNDYDGRPEKDMVFNKEKFVKAININYDYNI